MRGVFCPSDSHHVRRHLENPPNFRPLFFRIEKMMRKYPREICGETASQNMPRDLDTLSKDMRGVFCPSDSHHVRRHLENPLNFRPLFFRIEKMIPARDLR